MANKILVDLGKSWIGKIAMTNGHAKLDTNVNAHLFSNSHTPAETDTTSNYTEASYPGYAAQTLSGATDGGIDSNDRDTWSWPTQTWQCSSAPGSPVTVYGIYYTDSGNTTLLWVELFDSPFTFTNSGDGFTFPPTFSFGSIF